ncbi:MAG: hypothetical protein H0T50_01680 [Gemmatimonadales bacterium]|nr:hypothetical protein [Gemmatimonadales bacterium]
MTNAPDSGWARLAAAVAEMLPPEEVDGVWIFSPLRHQGNEWGTAVLSRVDGHRRRIYTARYVLAVRGKELGKFQASVQEVGSGPVAALARLLQDAQKRIDDEQPPIPVAPASWFSEVPAAGTADGSGR